MANLHQILDSLIDQGFNISESGRGELTIAFLSLRIAIKSWFSTYRSFVLNINWVDPSPEFKKIISETEIYNQKLRSHSTSYFEAYSEIIIHFHHFVELVLKDILRQEHELFVSDASKKPIILHKLLKGEKISDDEIAQLKSIEFSETKFRIEEILKENRIDTKKFGFILDNIFVLECLNRLRNRLLHRGTFVLPYNELDQLVGAYILPFISQLVSLPEYNKFDSLWKYQELKCGIDPITIIIQSFFSEKYDLRKIAFLKELGRAAYMKPIEKKIPIFVRDDRQRAERIAALEREKRIDEIYDVKTCPVCGCNSLMVYYDIDSESSDPEDPGMVWLEAHSVQCLCCTFEINDDLKNPSTYKFPIEDYWFKEEIR